MKLTSQMIKDKAKEIGLELLCGTNIIQLAVNADEEYFGQAVRISAGNKGRVNLTIPSANVPGDLNVTSRTLGQKALSENAMIFDNGQQVTFSQIKRDIIREEQIKYIRTNWAGEVDLVVLDRGTDEIYGRVFWDITKIPVYNEDGTEAEPEYDKKLGIEFGNSSSNRIGPFEAGYSVRNGDYVAAKVNQGGTGYSRLVKLTQLTNVSASAWIGKSAVIFNGKTYEVSETVLCYNLDSKEWVTVEQALAYSDTANLYAKDGVVRIVEVSYHSR